MPAADASEPLLQIKSVLKRFGGVTAVDHLSLSIAAGEFFALLGPSGCGKTTLLRMLAGFETPDEGEIRLDGKDIAAAMPHQRPVNMMFQSYALFPHLSVRDNIAFGLNRAGLPKTEIDTRVAELVGMVRLGGLEGRKPDQLSGGQRQRVALARALARRPRILLLDEPLGALDRKLREETQSELIALQRRLGMTFIVVTHDQDEAMTMADRIGVMDQGRLVQVAPPRELYESPNSRWIAAFFGDINLFEGQFAGAEGSVIRIDCAGTPAVMAKRHGAFAPGQTVSVGIRPEKIRLQPRNADASAFDNCIPAVVEAIGYRGGMSEFRLRGPTGQLLKVAQANDTRAAAEPFAAGDAVQAVFTAADCVVLEH